MSIFNSQSADSTRDQQFEYEPEAIYITVLKCICLSVTILGNATVILVVTTNRNINRIQNNVFICSLAVADLLMGVVVMVVDTMSKDLACDSIDRTVVPLRSKLWASVRFFLMTCTVWNLCVICYDRYRFISNSRRYNSLMSRSKVILYHVLAWLFPLVMALCHLIIFKSEHIGQNTQAAMFLGILLISIILPVILIMISFVFYIQALCMSKKSANSGLASFETSEASVMSVPAKKIVPLSVIIVAFYLMWLPLIAVMFLHTTRAGPPKMCAAFDAAFWLLYMRSLVNPLIYTICCRNFRRAVIQMLKCSCSSSSDTDFASLTTHRRQHVFLSFSQSVIGRFSSDV